MTIKWTSFTKYKFVALSHLRWPLTRLGCWSALIVHLSYYSTCVVFFFTTTSIYCVIYNLVLLNLNKYYFIYVTRSLWIWQALWSVSTSWVEQIIKRCKGVQLAEVGYITNMVLPCLVRINDSMLKFSNCIYRRQEKTLLLLYWVLS